MPPPPQTPEPAPTLPDDLLEEVFLRLPPDEPAWLVRASLTNNLWLGLLTGTAFHGRYRDFHGAPPMLGFFYSVNPCIALLGEKPDPLFVSTTRFRARIPDDKDLWLYGLDPLDCRHGRVVLGYGCLPHMSLVVSDPMTGCWCDLGALPYHQSHGAAVLCAVTGCDHRACHDGPFRVVSVVLNMNLHLHDATIASVLISSPETGDCSKPSSDFHPGEWVEACSGFHIEGDPYIKHVCPVLVKDGLHFMLLYTSDDADDHDYRTGILKYDLSSNCLSMIDVPLDMVHTWGATILIALEDGSLGFAFVDGLTLYLWSRQLGSDGVASWTKCKVINLKEFLPSRNPEIRLELIGSVEGCDIIFVTTDLGIYRINLKTLKWKKIWNRNFSTFVPYMSFYTPQEL